MTQTEGQTNTEACIAAPDKPTLERIPRKVWDSMGGVNNPDLILRHAKRGPDRYYILRRHGGQDDA